jgi:hypothetical protein
VVQRAKNDGEVEATGPATNFVKALLLTTLGSSMTENETATNWSVELLIQKRVNE